MEEVNSLLSDPISKLLRRQTNSLWLLRITFIRRETLIFVNSEKFRNSVLNGSFQSPVSCLRLNGAICKRSATTLRGRKRLFKRAWSHATKIWHRTRKTGNSRDYARARTPEKEKKRATSAQAPGSPFLSVQIGPCSGLNAEKVVSKVQTSSQVHFSHAQVVRMNDTRGS